MALIRKLQAEIDKTLKKVDEGVEQYDSIWERVQAASTSTQKEKLEAELKKEIKRLQRYRDQIKSWASSSDVKDKDPLLKKRKVIETRMESFKEAERETKTKAYSKEGLARGAAEDPADAAKRKARDFLRSTISALEAQVDELEAEVEMLSAKKKPDYEAIGELEASSGNHKYHLEKLEVLQRLLDNDAVTADEVEGLRDDLEYYLESNKEPDFYADLEIYDHLELSNPTPMSPSLSASVDPSVGSGGGSETKKSKSKKEASPVAAPAPAPATTKKGKGSKTTTGTTSSKATSKATTTTTKSTTKTKSTTTLKVQQKQPRSAPPITSPKQPQPVSMANVLKSKAAAAAAAGGSSVTAAQRLAATTAASAATAAAAAAAGGAAATTGGKNGTAAPGGATAARVVAGGRQQPAMPPAVPAGRGGSAPKSSAAATSPATGPLASTAASPGGPVTPSIGPTIAGPTAASIVASSSSDGALAPGAGTTTTTAAAVAAAAGARGGAGDGVRAGGVGPGLTGGASGAEGTASSRGASAAIGTPVASSAGLDPTSAAAAAAASTASGSAAGAEGAPVPTAPMEHAPVLRPAELQRNLALLNSSLAHIPEPRDSERPKIYNPRNPHRTHPSFPQSPAANLDTPAAFEKLDTDSLFFVFYYQQGTYQQYLAARELKKQSWRFHKKYSTWFQRHEEPKTTTNEYECGTYVYFDYETGWCQRIKRDFTFEYTYLEDELAV